MTISFPNGNSNSLYYIVIDNDCNMITALLHISILDYKLFCRTTKDGFEPGVPRNKCDDSFRYQFPQSYGKVS